MREILKSIFPLVMFFGIGLSSNTAVAQPVAEGVVRIGTITHPAIRESSGLAASRRYPGVIWTHNDSGAPFLFAIREDGRWIRGFQVRGANLIDWEDIAIDNSGHLYLADIGTNGIQRSHVAVHKVREPNPGKVGAARVVRTWYLRFPGLREDCESFFVSRGAGYLITKQRRNGLVAIYSYPLSARGRSILLRKVTDLEVTASVTAADISFDSQCLALLTQEGAYGIAVNGNIALANIAPRIFTRFENTFMEGACFVGNGLLVSAETREIWLFTDPIFRTR